MKNIMFKTKIFHKGKMYLLVSDVTKMMEISENALDAIDLRIHTDLLVKMIVPDAVDTIFTDQIIDLEKLVWITDVSDMKVFA